MADHEGAEKPMNEERRRILKAGLGGAALLGATVALGGGIADALSFQETKPSGEYKKYGVVDIKKIWHYPLAPGALENTFAPAILDKTHGTVIMAPRQGWGGEGFGAFIKPVSKDDKNIYWTSFHEDPHFRRSDGSLTTIETVLVSDQKTFDIKGIVAVAISDGIHGGVEVFLSNNGGVDYKNTQRSFNYLLDDPDDPLADHQRTMRGQFQQIVDSLPSGK